MPADHPEDTAVTPDTRPVDAPLSPPEETTPVKPTNDQDEPQPANESKPDQSATPVATPSLEPSAPFPPTERNITDDPCPVHPGDVVYGPWPEEEQERYQPQTDALATEQDDDDVMPSTQIIQSDSDAEGPCAEEEGGGTKRAIEGEIERDEKRQKSEGLAMV